MSAHEQRCAHLLQTEASVHRGNRKLTVFPSLLSCREPITWVRTSCITSSGRSSTLAIAAGCVQAVYTRCGTQDTSTTMMVYLYTIASCTAAANK